MGDPPAAAWRVLTLQAVHAWDRLRLRAVRAFHPALEIHPSASAALAGARFHLAPGSRLRIGPGVVTERAAGRLHFCLEPGAQVEIGARTWLRTEIAEVHLIAFAGARIEIGEDVLLNGCHISAKRHVSLGRRSSVGFGSRIFDADQHDLDGERPERVEPVTVGEFAWIAGDVTVLRGVQIGAHAVVGTRSLVSRDVPPHTLAYGAPALARGPVGDRSRAR